MVNATKELRRLLDEYRIGWLSMSMSEYKTYWKDMNGIGATATEWGDGLLVKAVLTPERAISATIGDDNYQILRGIIEAQESKINRLSNEIEHAECRNVAPDYLDFLCSECGFVHYHSDENDDGEGNNWKYCPRCGRLVV